MDLTTVSATLSLLLFRFLATSVDGQVWTGERLTDSVSVRGAGRGHEHHAVDQRTTLAAWSDWTDTQCKVHCQEGSTCNTTCGHGFRWRTRTCSTGVNVDCESSGETAVTAVPCDVSCVVEWTSWETHSTCSHTCDHGFEQRTRNCTNGRVQDCSRAHANDWWEIVTCNYGPCPHWLEWATWSTCTVTCGTGAKGRIRACSTGLLSDCPGSHYQLVPCTVHCLNEGLGMTTVGTTTTPPRACSQLTSPAHGNVVLSDVIPGSTATFSCDAGYSLNGTAVLYCTSDGNWSGDSPMCSSMCSPLVNPTNGNVMVSNYVLGGTARFTCHQGYNVNGPELLYCLAEGHWSSTAPQCVVECPDIHSPRHGVVTPYSKIKGSSVTVYCISGYRLVGSGVRVCQDDGHWSGKEPTCRLCD